MLDVVFDMIIVWLKMVISFKMFVGGSEDHCVVGNVSHRVSVGGRI